MRKKKRQVFRRVVEEPYRINKKITAYQVRLVGDNVEPGVYPTEEALRVAATKGLDLVEISAKADVPICKVADYAKFKYEQKKKQKAIKARVQKTTIKEVRFGPNTDEHDFNFKLNHTIKFLEEGAKVKAAIHFKGRTIAFKERGELLLLKFAQALEKYGKVEQLPKMEGRRMLLTVSPRSTKKK